MKKLSAYFMLLLLIVACTPKDDVATPPALDPTKLSRLIYNPGTANERHWYFNAKGLLEKITEPNGTMLQKFEYSEQNNLISQITNQNGISYTANYTYDAQNHITSMNGILVTYDALENKYVIDYPDKEKTGYYEFEDKSILFLTEEGLYKNSKGYWSSWEYGDFEDTADLGTNMLNNNLIGYWDGDMVSYKLKYYNTINPIKAGVIGICRLKIFNVKNRDSFHVDGGQKDNIWLNPEYYSNNNVTSSQIITDSSEDSPMAAMYEYEYNKLNLPTKKIHNHGTAKDVEILYYYQGDIIP